jgi:LysM repeat protein
MTNELDTHDELDADGPTAATDHVVKSVALPGDPSSKAGDNMIGPDTNGDDLNANQPGPSPTGDEFWGATPDWTGTTPRTRRSASGRGTDVKASVRGWLTSAMTAGAGATREHRIIDAAAPRPQDPTDEYRRADVDPTMFDDLDTEIPLSKSGRTSDASRARRRPVEQQTFAYEDDITAEVPVIDVADRQASAEPADGFDGDDVDRDMLAFSPESMVSRSDRSRRGSGRIDPLLVRLGVAAIVTTLAIPILVSVASNDDSDDTIATSETASAPAPATTQIQPVITVPGPVAKDASAADPIDVPAVDPTSIEAPAATEPVGDIVDTTAADQPLVVGADAATKSIPEPAPDTTTASADIADQDDAPEIESSDESEEAPNEVNDAASVDDGAARIDNCAVDYTVQAGDYWIRIAQGAGVTLAELLEANGATSDTPLYPGNDICLPAGSSTPPPPSAPVTTSPRPVATPAPTPNPAPPTTTPAPATPVTTVRPATSGTEGVKQIIRDVWPDDLEARALEIAERESRFVPTAKNYCCYGLFQIYFDVHKGWLAGIGVTSAEQLFDPATNARAAYTLYQRSGGWGPWAL